MVQAWSVRVGCPMDVRWKDGLDRTVGQHARLVRVGCPLDRWTGQDSGASLVSDDGRSNRPLSCQVHLSNGCLLDVHWTGRLDRTLDIHLTGGLDRTVGPALSARLHGKFMSNRSTMEVHWTGGLDRTVGQAWFS